MMAAGVVAFAGFAFEAAADVTGKAQALAGDTLEVGGTRVRLYGIAAPAWRQTCTAGGREWRCGEEATFALAYETAEHWVRCEDRGHDADGALLAVCHVGPYDLNARMVRQGWAVADPRQTTAYAGEEAEARRAGAGLWRGEFTLPWEWRGN